MQYPLENSMEYPDWQRETLDCPAKKPELPEKFSFLYGKYTKDYLNDMKICQEFADENRKMIAKILVEKLDESPMAYKGIEDIVDNITETVSIDKILKPV